MSEWVTSIANDRTRVQVRWKYRLGIYKNIKDVHITSWKQTTNNLELVDRCAKMCGDRYNSPRSDGRVKSKILENPGLFRLSTKNLWSVSRNSLLLECGFENFFPFPCKICDDDRHHPHRTIGNVPFLLTQCGISHQWRTKWIRFQPTAPNEYWSKQNVKEQTFFNARYISSKVFQNCLKKYFKVLKSISKIGNSWW